MCLTPVLIKTNPLLILRVMVLNAIFKNISVISWRSALLVEETGVPGENHRSATTLTNFSHKFRTHNFVYW